MVNLRIKSQTEKLTNIAYMLEWQQRKIDLQKEKLGGEIGLFYNRKEVVERLEFLIEMNIRLRNYMKNETLKLVKLC